MDIVLCDRCFEGAEEFCGGREVALQEGSLTVGKPHDAPGQKTDNADLGPDVMDEEMVWLPRVQSGMIRAQDICDQQGSTGIVTGSTLSETSP